MNDPASETSTGAGRVQNGTATPHGRGARVASPRGPGTPAPGTLQSRGGPSSFPRQPGLPAAAAGTTAPAPGSAPRVTRSRERGPAKAPAEGGSVRASEAPAGSRTWTLELPAGMEMLSLNGREHWSARHRKAQAFKQATWALAKRARIPALGRVSIAAVYQPGDLRRRDPDNPIPSAKACIDGLVAAQVIPDDSARYVASVTSSIGSLYPKGRLVLTVTEVIA